LAQLNAHKEFRRFAFTDHDVIAHNVIDFADAISNQDQLAFEIAVVRGVDNLIKEEPGAAPSLVFWGSIRLSSLANWGLHRGLMLAA